MALQSFSHVGVCVSDLERSTAFYEEVLGFRQLFTMTMGDELAATMEIDGITFQSAHAGAGRRARRAPALDRAGRRPVTASAGRWTDSA